MRPPIFITLTTIAKRLCFLDQVLEKLINQTIKPDRILLNISLNPYMLDAGIRFEHLPRRTRGWVVSGLVELYYCENTGPYRKILPVINRFGIGNYFIAAADDDVFYPPEWLEVLFEVAVAHKCVAAYRCRFMEIADAELLPYVTWPLLISPADFEARGISDSAPSMRLFPTGRDGVMYHSTYFSDIEALRQLQALAPGQDDVALKFATLLAGVPLRRAPRQRTSARTVGEFPGPPIEGPHLFSTNVLGKNDEALTAVVEWCRRHRSFELPL